MKTRNPKSEIRSNVNGSGKRAPFSMSTSNPGFTLIELVISAGLMSLILVSAYLCLHAALSSQKLIEPRVEVLQSARVALALIAADLRCACPLAKDFDFVGTHRMMGETESDSLDFATHNYTPRRAHEGDFCAVSLFLDKNPRSGQLSLWRRRNPQISTDPLSRGSREELAKGVLGLRFEYSDGVDWYESWGEAEGRGKEQFSLRSHPNLSGMPEAVRITLWLNPNPHQKPDNESESSTNEPPLVFRTVARLNLADSNQSGPSSGVSTNAAPPANTQSQNQTQSGGPP
jgi:type II secretory pathway component PulJ